MSNFDKDTSFLRRTAQEAERRAVSAVFAPDVTAGILPIFWSKSFLFEEGEEPAHINRFATNPQHPGLFEVRGGTEIESAYGLAVDVPLFAMASLIAAARVRLLDSTNSKVRLHENLWILLPDKTIEQVSTVKPREN